MTPHVRFVVLTCALAWPTIALLLMGEAINPCTADSPNKVQLQET